jgi:hypothetical protein
MRAWSWKDVLSVRRYDAGDLLDTFFVSAVSALLLIRFVLKLTGYPQLGGHHLHIAHLLWGGLLMLIGILLLLTTLSRTPIHLAAAVAGLGWGTFIDELGKFLTRDNDYFFRPTIALIYVIFVLLYIASRALGRGILLTPKAALVNALELTKEAVIHDMDPQERRWALWLLDRSDPSHPVVPALREMLEGVTVVPPHGPARIRRARQWLRAWVNRISSSRTFPRVLLPVVILASALALLEGLLSIGPAPSRSISVSAWGQLVSSGVVALLVIWGLYRWPHSRLAAYRSFHRGALLAICVTQLFAFYREQLRAVTGLAIGVVLWSALRYLIHREERTAPDGGPSERPAGGPGP